MASVGLIHGNPLCASLARRENRILAFVLLGAGVLRLIYLLQYASSVPFLHVPISDSAYYHAWAERVASGEGYGPKPYYMAPLYPTLLGLLYRLVGPRPEVAAYVQSALGVLNLWLVALLGRRIAGSSASTFGVVLLGLYAPILVLETKVLTETLTITLLLSAILAGARALEGDGDARSGERASRGGEGWFFAWGGLMGLAALARPNLLALPVLVGLWASVRALRRRPIASVRAWGLAAAGVLLAIAPVTARNLIVGGDLVLISSNGGIVFAQGNHPHANGISTILPGFTPLIEEQQAQEMRLASQALGREVTPSESSAFWWRRGLAYALDDPAGFMRLWTLKALWALHAREPRDVYTLDLEAEVIPWLSLLFVPFPVLLGLAAFGTMRLPRPRHPGATLAWLGVAAIGATLVVFSMSFRYRAPAAPLLAPFAGVGLLRLWEALRGHRVRESALALACIAFPLAVSAIPYPIPAITAEAPANMGAAFLKRGDTERALRWTRRALSMDPHLASAHYNLGLILKERGDTRGAIEAFRASLRSRADDPTVRNDLAILLEETGRKEEAVSEYRAALRLRPDGRIAYNLALCLYDLGRYAESQEALRVAQSLGVRPAPEFLKTLQDRLGE